MKELSHPNQIIIVVGLGSSGIGVARLLNYNQKNVIVFERSSEEAFRNIAKTLEAEGIKVELGKSLTFSSFQPFIENLSQVVISPGISWDNITINQLRAKGITITSEIAIAWENLSKIPWIGVTGTNGKTTVTHLLNHVLNNNNVSSRMGGNVGTAASELALDFEKNPKQNPHWLVMELSSYQIESAPNISPKIGIWTTLTPDHLERHRTMKRYINIKRSLLNKSSIRIYNADDDYLASNKTDLPIGKWISTKGPGDYSCPYSFWLSSEGIVMEKNTELFDSNIFNLKGNHNLQNLLLATAAAREVGLSKEQIKDSIKTFKAIPHRLEKVNISNDLEIFNDSKATNFDSAEIALKAVSTPTLLIAGGRLKKGDSSHWLTSIKEKTCAVILFGESRVELKSLLKRIDYKQEIYTFQSLNQAVLKAVKMAQRLNAKSILFSPGCASFDFYRNFEERGNHFKKLIKDVIK